MSELLSAVEAADLSLRLVREAPLLSYDTETSGVDWKRNFPVGYVFYAHGAPSMYVPVRHGGGGNLPDRNVKVPETATDPIVIHRYEVELAAAFEDRKRLGLRTVGHNIKFDCHASANGGIMLGRNLSCTQNNETLLDEYAKAYSLDASAARHGVTAKKGQVLYDHIANIFGCAATRSSMEHFWKLSGDDPIAVDYACGDGVSTMELYESQLVKLEEQGLGQVFDLENRLIWTLFRMERRGIALDQDYLGYLQEEVDKRIGAAFDALPAGFNVRSPLHVKKYVEEAGHTNWPKTDLGNPSFTEKWLKTFPEGKSIVAVRKWTNLKNSFVGPLIERHMWQGRVHANINQLKSDDSGTPARLSCSDPNLQQIPKRDKDAAKLFRKAFVADKGMLFWEADYSQCEPRLFAHYSKDPNLVAGYCATPFKDVHTLVSEMLSVERDPTGKRVNMGIFTGMYPKTFAAHMEWPLDKATEMWNKWFEAFPGVKDFQDLAKQRILDRGYVLTLLKRRGRLDNPRFSYKATSKIIQGGNADILKFKMLELDEHLESLGDGSWINMTVHDAVEGQIPDSPAGRELLTDLLDKMVQVQGPPFNLRVPFLVEHDVGKNWCEATFGAGSC